MVTESLHERVSIPFLYFINYIYLSIDSYIQEGIDNVNNNKAIIYTMVLSFFMGFYVQLGCYQLSRDNYIIFFVDNFIYFYFNLEKFVKK